MVSWKLQVFAKLLSFIGLHSTVFIRVGYFSENLAYWRIDFLLNWMLTNLTLFQRCNFDILPVVYQEFEIILTFQNSFACIVKHNIPIKLFFAIMEIDFVILCSTFLKILLHPQRLVGNVVGTDIKQGLLFVFLDWATVLWFVQVYLGPGLLTALE